MTMFALWQYNRMSEKRPLTLDTVLLCTSKFRASNSSDQIFALLGISDCADVEELQPDYDRAPEEIFTGVSRFLLTTRGTSTVQLLSAAGVGHNSNRRAIPSWAIDRDERRQSLMLTDAWISEDSFNAAGGTDAVVYAGKQNGTMVIRGILLKDEISRFSPGGVLNLGGLQPGEEVHSMTFWYYKKMFCRAAIEMVHNHRLYMWNDVNMIDDDLWRTLIANRIDRKLVTNPRWRVIAHAWAYCMDYIDVDDREFTLRFQSVIARYGLELGDWDYTNVLTYINCFMEACYGRQFAITETGRLCLTPPLAKVGDRIFVPFGAQVPYLVRKAEGNEGWELIGESYVQGLMMGEVMESNGEIEDLVLV